MMTSAQIRQSFLDFFRSKQHTIVPSSSLLPDSPNLLFTNAGMNQFVPIFLGERKADVNTWGGASTDTQSVGTRAADTQKCIRAGGKHNDLEDVGLDTYHHTFFEMLGNWSFGDYFKKEAIDWAWELVVGIWKFPAERIYATIYNPDNAKGDPAERDEEAWGYWAEKFLAVGLDPAVHIVNGNKKDNFWMMGDTGPCGPCSEIHVDLTPNGDTAGALVNAGDARCIEIWNLVFIQFNANPDGTFTPLPARHVDTGMGFERVASIIQGTKGFSDFATAHISNYETDVFRPIFDEIEKMSGLRYRSTLPSVNAAGQLLPETEQEKIDVAFRVLADHIRTLSFAIADGIQPGNTDRNYVLRRILRRAVRYGRTLGFHKPFFYLLTDVLVRTMGDIFPEIRTRQAHVKEVLFREEEAFNKTLDRGMELFNEEADRLGTATELSGAFVFKLYDTYGFPLDLTELIARERGLAVDRNGFEELMEAQRDRARKAQTKQVIELSSIDAPATEFIGYETFSSEANVLDVISVKDRTAVILDRTPAYAEMGGQVGDAAELSLGGALWRVVNTQKTGDTWLHFIDETEAPATGAQVTIAVDFARRSAIQRHHTVTHLLHWALHEVVSHDATQKGSFVGPDKLTFDFNSAALTAQQIRDIEKLVNERIVENASVSWREVPFAEVKSRPEIMQFFGDKYGDRVRVVQIGGAAGALDGYSMELCGGTHTRATGEIGLFRIQSEAAIAAGVRRIEAVAGLVSADQAMAETERLRGVAARLNAPVAEIEKKIESFLAQQKELERALKSAQQRLAAAAATQLLEKVVQIGTVRALVAFVGEADATALQAMSDSLKGTFDGIIFLAGVSAGAVGLVATVPAGLTSQFSAGKLVQIAAPIVGGKGGGKPDSARGGGKDGTKIEEALNAVRSQLGAS